MKKWLLLLGILGSALVLLGSVFVQLRIERFQCGYILSRLQAEHEEMLAVQRKLQLEWSRLQDPFRLEESARKQFGLGPPREDQRVLMR